MTTGTELLTTPTGQSTKKEITFVLIVDGIQLFTG